ncbi:hypothetical protein TNCV_2779241 [Trichonephila clavipes]|nr:hypothetical protein TNCV_2779241 [Trichonephila clavipes]
MRLCQRDHPHVLNHCKIHSTAWRRKHDAIQNRIKKAIPSHLGSVVINKKFPGVSPTLIPDLVLRKHGGETVIVDFTVAFEDRYESLVAARNAKILKYLPILQSLRVAGKPAYLDAIVTTPVTSSGRTAPVLRLISMLILGTLQRDRSLELYSQTSHFVPYFHHVESTIFVEAAIPVPLLTKTLTFL